MSTYDAVVLGAGPNGLAASIELARHGQEVLLVEGAEEVGGGVRSSELTLPGYIHDVCSAVYPLAAASPFFSRLPLQEHGLDWIHPPLPLAHPFGDGEAACLFRDLDQTGDRLGLDGDAYRKLLHPFLERWDTLLPVVLSPLSFPPAPVLMARFGMQALRSAERLARGRFKEVAAQALFAGNAAHSFLRLDQPVSAAVALVLLLAGHAVGWPMPRGGAGALSRALASYFESLGGKIVTDWKVERLGELPEARLTLLNLTPKQVGEVCRGHLPDSYLQALRGYRYGPGAFKLDWALSGPIPWTAEACKNAGTVHVGGTLEEVARSEAAPWAGKVGDRPFVLLSQPTLFDQTRAPDGKHIAWAYCHVPNGFEGDVTDRIETQIERFAPGFRDRILARSVLNPRDLEARNPNLVGGDINGGVADLSQLFFRPRPSLRPYRTPKKGTYLCSSSTPPGGGVHGMCGYHAARSALRDLGLTRQPNH